MTSPVWAAVVPAAGTSSRMGRDRLALPWGGRPVLLAALSVLDRAGLPLIVVGVRSMSDAARIDPSGIRARVQCVEGGLSRQETVGRCLRSLPPDVDHVLVHDGARPACTARLIRRVQDAAQRTGAACAAIPLVDALHRAAADGTIAGPVDRNGLWCAQTPQGFRRGILEDAHASGGRSDDDAGLCAAAGHPVTLVEGERSNIKITHPQDLLEPRLETAVGTGYDVHRLVPGRPLVLGGVTVPHPAGPLGWSDGDVLCHALADAVLGAAGLGDIGIHFPPGAPETRGMASLHLLSGCAAMAREAGWEPMQADCCVIAERPRLRPHVDAMRQNLAEALQIEATRINVKAGTQEGLGAIGRAEGIGAHAVALLRRREPL